MDAQRIACDLVLLIARHVVLPSTHVDTTTRTLLQCIQLCGAFPPAMDLVAMQGAQCAQRVLASATTVTADGATAVLEVLRTVQEHCDGSKDATRVLTCVVAPYLHELQLTNAASADPKHLRALMIATPIAHAVPPLTRPQFTCPQNALEVRLTREDGTVMVLPAGGHAWTRCADGIAMPPQQPTRVGECTVFQSRVFVATHGGEWRLKPDQFVPPRSVRQSPAWVYHFERRCQVEVAVVNRLAQYKGPPVVCKKVVLPTATSEDLNAYVGQAVCTPDTKVWLVTQCWQMTGNVREVGGAPPTAAAGSGGAPALDPEWRRRLSQRESMVLTQQDLSQILGTPRLALAVFNFAADFPDMLAVLRQQPKEWRASLCATASPLHRVRREFRALAAVTAVGSRARRPADVNDAWEELKLPDGAGVRVRKLSTLTDDTDDPHMFEFTAFDRHVVKEFRDALLAGDSSSVYWAPIGLCLDNELCREFLYDALVPTCDAARDQLYVNCVTVADATPSGDIGVSDPLALYAKSLLRLHLLGSRRATRWLVQLFGGHYAVHNPLHAFMLNAVASKALPESILPVVKFDEQARARVFWDTKDIPTVSPRPSLHGAAVPAKRSRDRTAVPLIPKSVGAQDRAMVLLLRRYWNGEGVDNLVFDNALADEHLCAALLECGGAPFVAVSEAVKIMKRLFKKVADTSPRSIRTLADIAAGSPRLLKVCQQAAASSTGSCGAVARKAFKLPAGRTKKGAAAAGNDNDDAEEDQDTDGESEDSTA